MATSVRVARVAATLTLAGLPATDDAELHAGECMSCLFRVREEVTTVAMRLRLRPGGTQIPPAWMDSGYTLKIDGIELSVGSLTRKRAEVQILYRPLLQDSDGNLL